MQQVIQPIDGRATEVAQTPAPICGPRQVLIANRFSLISAGTERHTVELARQPLLQKARSRPDHVRRVLEKVRQEGLRNTVRQVQARLGQPMPLGYSSAGVVLEVGEEIREFQVGDRVASNGPHAGIVAIGKNLVARVPDAVPLEHACYGVVGSIALQGIRLANVGIGDVVAVIGLGLIGQLTVALLKAAGCVVLGTDLDTSKRSLAMKMGADAVADGAGFNELVQAKTAGRGADAALITASTASDGPLTLAAKIARAKAKIVAIGAVGMNVPRREFYPKELELVVSCSYGPGRYDPAYEEQGLDYPAAYVRWTEQRNIAAVLEQMAAGRLPVDKLTTHQFEIDNALAAYQMIEAGAEPYVGIVLEYPADPDLTRRVWLKPEPGSVAGQAKSPRSSGSTSAIGVSFLGAGNFASATLLPGFQQAGGFEFRGLMSAGGLNSRTLGKKYGFAFAGTDYHGALEDSATSAVVIATRHHDHTPQGLAALRAGKAVFMEKPLAISEEQFEEWLEGIDDLGAHCPIWTIGFNRRFSPAVALMRDAFKGVLEPRMLAIRFNAGRLPTDHWAHDPRIGGGRIIGEACHAIDLATALLGSPPTNVYARVAAVRERAPATEDDVAITLGHRDGSVSTILYCAGGDRAAGKERVEMFGGGRAATLDDFRSLDIHKDGRRIVKRRWWSQQKGYAEEINAFRDALALGKPPIPYEELLAVTSASLRAVTSLRLEIPLEIDGAGGAKPACSGPFSEKA